MTRAVRILDLDPDLGADLDEAAFAEARDLIVVPAIDIPAGAWVPSALAEHPAARGRVFACLIHEGLSVREIKLADRASTQLFGPGDLIAVDGMTEASLPFHSHHQAPDGVTVAPLDDRFLAACRRWPRLTARLMDLATEQLNRTSVHQAISQLPRVEDRLLALFWLLADRWAQVSGDGVVVRLPLTHEALGRLIGARRPTVSLGLRALAEQQTLTRREGGEWLLHAESLAVLESGEDPEVVRAILSRRRRAPAPEAEPVPAVLPASAERDDLLRRVAALRDQLGVGQARTRASIARNRESRARLTELRNVRLAATDQRRSA